MLFGHSLPPAYQRRSWCGTKHSRLVMSRELHEARSCLSQKKWTWTPPNISVMEEVQETGLSKLWVLKRGLLAVTQLFTVDYLLIITALQTESVCILHARRFQWSFSVIVVRVLNVVSCVCVSGAFISYPTCGTEIPVCKSAPKWPWNFSLRCPCSASVCSPRVSRRCFVWKWQ